LSWVRAFEECPLSKFLEVECWSLKRTVLEVGTEVSGAVAPMDPAFLGVERLGEHPGT
jgi:hypothetical protein